ncbi:hypothetical protein COUCH_19135 [Couchioplanes caeruleus]|uniref:hypothetical protein n=1 Tax=Couchioplanes caeruleus TaxID=56438 RepID=UPI0020BE7275|nr:hypothetical protein [Couchioplanes caeruleus]UQU68268.1 hypothetical protein COUCH_19135 [Couchioplanes caeruleus]
MTATVLLDRAIHVSCATVEVGPGAEPGDDPEAFWRGQVNGLCGAAARGFLTLVTGLHTGYVSLRVELHTGRPPLGDEWEEAVEVSFRHRAKKLWVRGLMSEAYPAKLPPGDYRVRYCARGMEEGRRQDTAGKDEIVDAYVLQFWPAEAEPDRIGRQTSQVAASWHRANPKPAVTDADRAQAKRRKAQKRARAKAEAQRAEDRLRWGDRVPGKRLRDAGRRAGPVDHLDADLVFALAETDDETCAAVARWVAGRAVTVAGLDRLPQVVAALAAADRGQRMPPAEEWAPWTQPFHKGRSCCRRPWRTAASSRPPNGTRPCRRCSPSRTGHR